MLNMMSIADIILLKMMNIADIIISESNDDGGNGMIKDIVSRFAHILHIFSTKFSLLLTVNGCYKGAFKGL